MLRLRPGVFTPDEQAQYEEVKSNISSTAWLALAGFLGVSGYRYWAIRTSSGSIAIGLSCILASYTPAMIYYKIQVNKESLFIRDLSEKYKDRIDDNKLASFVDSMPKESSPFSSFSSFTGSSKPNSQ